MIDYKTIDKNFLKKKIDVILFSVSIIILLTSAPNAPAWCFPCACLLPLLR